MATTHDNKRDPQKAAGATLRPSWQVNRRRLRLFGMALGLLLVSGLWFCWFQPLPPVRLARPEFPAWDWWWQPREQNADRRLPRVDVDLHDCCFIGQAGWAVGDNGTILRTEDGGRTWNAQPAPTTESLNSVAMSDTQHGWAVGGSLGWAVGGNLKSNMIILRTEDGGQTWNAQTAPPKVWLRSVAMSDAQHGWAVGEWGTILRTEDGGRAWNHQTAPTARGLNSVAMSDGQHGWAVGDSGTILRTEDGGRTWNLQTAPTEEDLNSVAMSDAQHGWAVGEKGTILRTEDGGRTWNLATVSKASLNSVAMSDAQHGWAVGDSGTILRTEDGGQTWNVQTAPTKGGLHSVAMSDAQHGWAVGEKGTILRIEAGGRTWNAQTAPTQEPLNSVAMSDAQHGWAVGDSGTILRTEDGGRTWNLQTALTARGLNSVAMSDAQHGWAVGDSDTILRTEDSGRTWNLQTAPTKVWLRSVAMSDAQHGWAVGDSDTILRTEDGGRTWNLQTAPPHRDVKWIFGRIFFGRIWAPPHKDLNSVAMSDAQHGWAVGDSGTILRTEDGGRTWNLQTAPTQEDLNSVAMSDAQHGWAVGEKGTILRTEDGGRTWNLQTAPTQEDLNSVAMSDAQHGWVVGWGGTILRTEDGGRTWNLQTAPTQELLRSVAMSDAQHGWAVGGDIWGNSVILRTEDGGRTWHDERPYSRLPAPLFFLSLALAAGLVVRGVRLRPEPSLAGHSIADYAVSDRPLRAGDFDALNFGPLADGIARFLLNEHTQAPLTLAITGPWGSGKSSLMGLLKERLVKRRFRPVWFNAWHHQGEEQILAALLETIRAQAVPPWRSLGGLRFRARLIHRRIGAWWPGWLLGVFCVAALAVTARHGGGDWSQWFTRWSGASSLFLPGKLAVLAGALFGLVKLGNGLRAFGVNPATLLASMTDKAKLSALKAQTGFRHRFAREFRDVTAALSPRTMTVFIDDLDRCEPAQVVQVMKTLNFLSNAGECFLILGMDEAVVANGVMQELKERFDWDWRTGASLEERERKTRQQAYARNWMEKLIQIRIPVPTPDTEQFRVLLHGPLAAERKPNDKDQEAEAQGERGGQNLAARAGTVALALGRWLARQWQESVPFLPWVAAVAVAWLGAELANRYLEPRSLPSPAAPTALTVWPTNSALSPNDLTGLEATLSGTAPGAALMTNQNLTGWLSTQRWNLKLKFASEGLRRLTQGTNPAPETVAAASSRPEHSQAVSRSSASSEVTRRIIYPEQEDHTARWIFEAALFVLLALSVAKALDWLDPREQDSEDFRKALDDWSDEINRNYHTPRAAKRLVNKLRFYAMLMRALQQIGLGKKIPERAIVALGVVEDRIKGGADSRKVIEQELGRQDLKDDCRKDLEALLNAWDSNPAFFRFLKGSMSVKAQTGA